MSRQSSRSLIILVLSVTVLGGFSGCGDDPKTQMSQAQIALSNGKPDLALEYVTSVLEKQPGQLEPMMLKARAQMMLARLGDAKKTLDAIIKTHPKEDDARQLLVKWAYRDLERLKNQSGFAADNVLQKRFDEVYKLGLMELDGLAQRGGDEAEIAIERAQFAERDASRWRAMVQSVKVTISRTDHESEGGSGDHTTAHYQREIDRRLNEAEGYLRTAIEVDPRHFKACERFTNLLVQRDRWLDLWDLAQTLSNEKDLPSGLASILVEGLLRMPQTFQTFEARHEIGWKILSTVEKEQKKSRRWRKSAALMYMNAKDWTEARALLEAVVKQNPNDDEAGYQLAYTLHAQKEYIQAKNILERLRQKPLPKPVLSQVEGLYGLTLMETDSEMTLAKEALRRAIELNPSNQQAHVAFLDLMAREGQLSNTREDVEAFYKANQSDPRAITFMLRFEIAQGQRDAAAELLEKVESISPLTNPHRYLLVNGFAYLNQIDKSLMYARQIVKNDPDNLDNHLILAGAMLRKGQVQEVKEILTDLKQKFPQATNVDYLLGQLYLSHRLYDRAIETLQTVVEANPKNTQARLQLAKAYFNLNMAPEGLEQIDQVIEQVPDHLDAHLMAAQVYKFTLQNNEKAQYHLSQIDESRIDEQTYPLLLATLKIQKGDIDGALMICNRAVNQGSNEQQLWIALARIYEYQKDLSQAEESLKSWVHSQPDSLMPYLALSEFYVRHREIQRGLSIITEFQRLNETFSRIAQANLLAASKPPDYDEAIARLQPIYNLHVRKRQPIALNIAKALAKIYLIKGDLKNALAVYDPMIEAEIRINEVELERIRMSVNNQPLETTLGKLDALAATLTPDQGYLYREILKGYRNLGEYDRALKLVDQWFVTEPNHPTLLRMKGDILLQKGDSDAAIAVYQKGIELAPESIPMRQNLARAYTMNLDYPGAEATLRKAAEIDSGSQIISLTKLGGMYVSLGLHRQARATFEELENSGHPNDPRVLLEMGRAYMALHENALAKGKFTEIRDYQKQYPVAQVLLARIEQEEGMIDEAKNRLETLARDRRFASTAVVEMMALKKKNNTFEDLVRLSDKALSLQVLPDPVKFQWLNVRLNYNMNEGDWITALETLERLYRLAPDSLQIAAARIMVYIRLGQVEQARQLYNSTPILADTWAGPLLALAVRETPSEKAERPGLSKYLLALLEGDLAVARSAAEGLPPRRTLYQGDLIQFLERHDVQSKNMVNSYLKIGLALVAQEFSKIPQLAEDLCRSVTARRSGIPLAYSVLVQALIDQDKLNEDVLTETRRSLPNSSLTLYLSARKEVTDESFDKAVTFLQKLLEREPNNDHINYYLSQILQQANRIDESIAVLEEIYNSESGYKVLAGNDLSYLLAENHPDRLDEAYKIASQTYEAVPGMVQLQDTIGWIEYMRGRYEEAAKHLCRAGVSLNYVPSVHYHLGLVYQALKQNQWAKYHLQAASEGEGDSPDIQKAKDALSRIGS